MKCRNRKKSKAIIAGLLCIQSEKYEDCNSCPYKRQHNCHMSIARDARLLIKEYEQMLRIVEQDDEVDDNDA